MVFVAEAQLTFRKVLLGILLLPAAVSAHHSFAEYDRTVVHEMQGVLTGVRWRNPHVTFSVRAEDSSGDVQEWQLETSALYLLERAGLNAGMFSVGEPIRIAGWVSERRPNAMHVANALLPDGREILFSPGSRPRWTDDATGNQWLDEPLSREELGIFRIWSVANLSDYGRATGTIDFRLTPEAQGRMPATPPLDPCTPQGMPGTMITPLPFELIDRGDHIDLQLTTFGVLRRIELDAENPTEAVPLTDLGYSVGAWDGGALVVTTSRIGWPYLDDEGRPQTPDAEVFERFELLEDGARLRYTQTVSDPGSLVEPMTVGWDMLDIGESRINPLHCE
jgi:hypothetical protein